MTPQQIVLVIMVAAGTRTVFVERSLADGNPASHSVMAL